VADKPGGCHVTDGAALAAQVVTGVLGAGGLLTGAAALWAARNSQRDGVNGDAREARRLEAEQQRDTIADRDALVDQLQEDVGSMRAEIGGMRREMREQAAELELERAYTRELIDHIYRGAPPPPPARPVRTP